MDRNFYHVQQILLIKGVGLGLVNPLKNDNLGRKLFSGNIQ